MSHRCTECRRTFVPAASAKTTPPGSETPAAKTTQRVCGAACRAARDRKLARARRRRDVEAYRADEQARQQAFRERRAAGHAGASAPKSEISQDEVAVIVARVLEASRATLVREMRLILVRSGPRAGEAVAGVTHEAQAVSTRDG